ncbi:MAG: putative Ig domain-containing protein [Bacteroidetes bacterium]|nr:putative Ig domain-containing protein [Bacteroidota bacterium]
MKRMFTLPMQMATMLIVLFALALPANAAAPGTPRNFTATVAGNPQYIQLQWNTNEEFGKADGYKIFLASGQTDNLEKFKLQATQNEGTKYSIANLATGTYSVFVKAYNADGESDRTDFRFVTIQKANNEVLLKFKTEPSHSATSGKEYVYEAKAVSNDGNLDILYRLDGDIPDGMTIDSKTGVVRWTPTKDGSYKYIVVAYLAGSPDVKAIQIVELRVGIVQEDAIRFVTEPNRVATSAKLYTYQPKIVTNDPSVKVTFKLDYAPDGMTIDENTGLISWTPTKDGEYKVSITANIPGTTLKATQAFVIVVGKSNNGGGDKEAIRFITKPLESGCTGKEYVYDAEAISLLMSPLPLEYKLVTSPDGMTIDAKSGLIRWTPTNEGDYKVSIMVAPLNSLTPNATQSFTVRISAKCEIPAQVCAKIFGKVVADNGTVINGGTVRAVRLEKSNKGEASFYGKINDGQYYIAVTEGTYALIVSGEGIVEEWYMDATSIDKATPVSVKCDEKIEANFSVATREKPKNIVIEGTVTNANGEGIFAMVEFIVKDKNGADNKDMMGRFVTKTGEKGNYRIEIPQNLIVIAHAIPVSDKYLDQYFEKVNNPEEATRLTLSDNMAVNFVLLERASYNNGFAGKVRDSASVGINARVVAYRIVTSDKKEPIRYEALTVETNANGEFNIANLIPGEYFLFAIPREKQGFIPGYYKSGDFAAVKWQDATHITVGEVMIDQVFEIILRPSYGKRGGAKLGGKVSHRGGIAKAGAVILGEAPLSGAYLLAYDETGNVSDYIFSDDQGTFTLNELTAGNFTLATDKPGFVSQQTTAMVDYAKLASVQVNIVVDAQSVSGVEEDVVVASTGGLVFPNPASNRVNVRLNSSINTLTVRVINTLGGEVLRFNAETSGSDSIVSFDTATLPNGMYSINIQGGERPISLPLTIIR